MIHTDGKPTIAHRPPTPPKPMPEPPRKLPVGSLRRKLADAEKRIRVLESQLADHARYGHCAAWQDCPCAQCSENDPDSMPGGYDNPAEPIDWEDMA